MVHNYVTKRRSICRVSLNKMINIKFFRFQRIKYDDKEKKK